MTLNESESPSFQTKAKWMGHKWKEPGAIWGKVNMTEISPETLGATAYH